MSSTAGPVPIQRVRAARQKCDTPGCDKPGRHVSVVEQKWGEEGRLRCMTCCNAIEDAEEVLRTALIRGVAED